MSWTELGLDPRILRSLEKQGFSAPTLVQAAAIPKALEGKDIVARARTGSGKTLAYLLPALHKVLVAEDSKIGWRALILVPTRELCEQVRCGFRFRLQRSAAAAAVSRCRRRCSRPPSFVRVSNDSLGHKRGCFVYCVDDTAGVAAALLLRNCLLHCGASAGGRPQTQ
jgi:superfamily II helicase